MVRSNMGLLLSNNITTITVDVHKDEAAFNIQIVTTPFHEENENLQLQGISFTNFNDMWAFVPENQLDKTILRFDRDASGKPSASFYAPAQNLAEALSLVQQRNFDQEDEINQLKLRLEQAESYLEDANTKANYSRSISYAELMIFACGFFILMNLFYSAFQI